MLKIEISCTKIKAMRKLSFWRYMQCSLQTILAYRLYKFQIKNHRLLRKQVFPATMNCKLQDSSRVAKF